MEGSVDLSAYEKVKARFLDRKRLSVSSASAGSADMRGLGEALEQILSRGPMAPVLQQPGESYRGKAQTTPACTEPEDRGGSIAGIAEILLLELRLAFNYETRARPELCETTQLHSNGNISSLWEVLKGEEQLLRALRTELWREAVAVEKDHFCVDDILGMVTAVSNKHGDFSILSREPCSPSQAVEIRRRLQGLRMIALLGAAQRAQYLLRTKAEECQSQSRRLKVVSDFAREEQCMREEAETALVRVAV
jgi:hypothetical protein